MSYNYSSLATANKCLKLYDYQYIQKIQQDGDESGDLAFGSALHAALHSSLTDQENPASDVFKVYWDSLKDKPVQYSRFGWEDLGTQGLTFIQRFEKLHKKNFKVIQAEERLYAEINQIKFEGTPDCIAEYKGVTSIVDWKTSAYAYDKDKILIAEQLALYKLLAYKSLGVNATQLVYFVFIKGTSPRIQILTHQPTKEEMDQFTQNLLHGAARVEKAVTEGVFPRNTNSCIQGSFKCPMFSKCYIKKIVVDSQDDS